MLAKHLAPWVVAAVVAGCGEEAAAPSSATLKECAGPDESKAPKDVRGDDEAYDVAHDSRQAPNCEFDRDSLTDVTIGPKAPKPPTALNVVVVMLENRSFDHYLSGVPGTDYKTDRTNPNPALDGGKSKQEEAQDYCLPDTAHEWGAAHLEYDNGLMDGFVAVNNPHGERTLAYYTEGDLPFPHWLAEHFAVGDRYFSSLIGPTWPNRLFLFKGTSCGYTLGGLDGNGGIVGDCSYMGTNLLRRLDEAGLHHKLYDEAGLFSITAYLGLDSLRPFSEFVQDALDGNLPEFSMVGASNGQELDNLKLSGIPQDDDHPTADVRLGQVFMYRVLQALMANQQTWERTVLFITYDENGGFYDHVPPPLACEPVKTKQRYDYAFDRYGFRVPFFVVSPYVKEKYVGHHVTDHASIARFVEHVWGLKAMTKRDANAWPLLDYFDFSRKLPKVPLPPEPTVAGGCAKPKRSAP